MENKIYLIFTLLIFITSCDKKKLVMEPEIVLNDSIYETFDSLDFDKWQISNHSFEGNGANFIAENVKVKNSILELKTTINSNSNLPKNYNAGEIIGKEFYMYGYFEVRMKPLITPGTVGAFFLMNEWVPTNWEHQEIDIEFTGNKPTSIQMTTHHFQDGGTNHLSSTAIKDLGFNYADDFHNYGIKWTPDSVSWYVDGIWIHTETQYVPRVPLSILMNHWPGDMSHPGMINWLDEIDDNELPTTVEYDWIKVTE